MFAKSRPYYTVEQMRAELEDSFHTDTIRDKFSTLRELGIVSSKSVGSPDIYYIKSDKSEWPIPTDVEVQSERTEPTVAEFFGRWYV